MPAMSQGLQLGVNIDHVATLRQARYREAHGAAVAEPDPVWAAVQVELAAPMGSPSTCARTGVTCRIATFDCCARRSHSSQPRNGRCPEIIGIAEEVKPDEACLVPEKRAEVTTEADSTCAVHTRA